MMRRHRSLYSQHRTNLTLIVEDVASPPNLLPSSSSTTSNPNDAFDLIRRSPPYRARDFSPETRARMTEEYYQTYDSTTGLRIAATLGGIISLFALFLLYKSKCRSYKDEDDEFMAMAVAKYGTSTDVRTNTRKDQSCPPGSGGCCQADEESVVVVVVDDLRSSNSDCNGGFLCSASSSGSQQQPPTVLYHSSSSVSTESEATTAAPIAKSSKCSVDLHAACGYKGDDEDSVSSSSSTFTTVGREVVICKKHVRVQYRVSPDMPSSSKSEDV